eukprot:12916025-Alexandrium_andersonii.AAC.1
MTITGPSHDHHRTTTGPSQDHHRTITRPSQVPSRATTRPSRVTITGAKCLPEFAGLCRTLPAWRHF